MLIWSCSQLYQDFGAVCPSGSHCIKVSPLQLRFVNLPPAPRRDGIIGANQAVMGHRTPSRRGFGVRVSGIAPVLA